MRDEEKKVGVLSSRLAAITNSSGTVIGWFWYLIRANVLLINGLYSVHCTSLFLQNFNNLSDTFPGCLHHKWNGWYKMIQILKIHIFMSFYFSWSRKIKLNLKIFPFFKNGIPAARLIHNTSSSKQTNNTCSPSKKRILYLPLYQFFLNMKFPQNCVLDNLKNLSKNFHFWFFSSIFISKILTVATHQKFPLNKSCQTLLPFA
jgi:hypothetical protein